MNFIILILFILVSCKTSSSSSSLVDSEVKSVSTESSQKDSEADTQTTVKKTVTQDPSKITEKEEEFLIIPVPGKRPISVLKNRRTKITDIGTKLEAEETTKNEQLKIQEELHKKQELEDKLKAEAEATKLVAPSVGCAFVGWMYIAAILAAIVGIAIPLFRSFADKLPFPFNLLAKRSKE